MNTFILCVYCQTPHLLPLSLILDKLDLTIGDNQIQILWHCPTCHNNDTHHIFFNHLVLKEARGLMEDA